MRTLRAIFGTALALGSGAGLALATSAALAGPVEDAVAAAMRDSETGRCDQAVQRFSGIEGVESRALLLGGQCRIRQGLYPEALLDLDRARRAGDLSGPLLGDVELYRAIALYHLERYTEAESALDNAEGLSPDEAQLSLYRGLIALRRNDNDRAAPALEQAARMAPGVTEPVASYYAGLAWQGASERAKARDAFQRVVDIDPDGPWGKEAARLLESTRLFPAYARLSAGFEYDDNVRLRARGTDTNGAGDKDWRAVWSADAGIQLFSLGDWTGGVQGSYTGTAQFDLTSFDTHYPLVGAFLNRRLGPNTDALLQYQFGHAWVEEDPFLRTQSILLALEHTWEKAGTTEIAGDVTWNEFFYRPDDPQEGPPGGVTGSACVPALGVACAPAGIRERSERDRDGYGLGAGVEHRYLLPLPRAIEDAIETLVLRGSYRFGYYDSEGTEWEYISNRVAAGITFEFPYDISLDASAAYERLDFEHPSTFPDEEIVNQQYGLSGGDRTEDVIQFDTEIEKDINEQLSVSARYSFFDDSSNRRVYNYDRHIVGGYVNFRFD